MTIKLSVRADRRLKQCKDFVPIESTLLNEAGPAHGTIWHDRLGTHRHPYIVDSVKNGLIAFEGAYYSTVQDFLRDARNGRYILLGLKSSNYETRHLT